MASAIGEMPLDVSIPPRLASVVSRRVRMPWDAELQTQPQQEVHARSGGDSGRHGHENPRPLSLIRTADVQSRSSGIATPGVRGAGRLGYPHVG
jgi:hypothetical protein